MSKTIVNLNKIKIKKDLKYLLKKELFIKYHKFLKKSELETYLTPLIDSFIENLYNSLKFIYSDMLFNYLDYINNGIENPSINLLKTIKKDKSLLKEQEIQLKLFSYLILEKFSFIKTENKKPKELNQSFKIKYSFIIEDEALLGVFYLRDLYYSELNQWLFSGLLFNEFKIDENKNCLYI